MTSRERVQNALNHRTPDYIPIDFGATSVTGIHCKVVEALRQHYGLDAHPVRIIEPFQMLGEIEDDLQEVMGIDCVPVFGRKNMFDIDETQLHEQITRWRPFLSSQCRDAFRLLFYQCDGKTGICE